MMREGCNCTVDELHWWVICPHYLTRFHFQTVHYYFCGMSSLSSIFLNVFVNLDFSFHCSYSVEYGQAWET